jgi:hypothetical protein
MESEFDIVFAHQVRSDIVTTGQVQDGRERQKVSTNRCKGVFFERIGLDQAQEMRVGMISFYLIFRIHFMALMMNERNDK